MSGLIPINSPTLAPCALSAWITPSHGFVEFACGSNMSSTVGFGPPAANKYTTIGALINLPYKGTISQNGYYRSLCESKKISCLVSRLETTPAIVELAWREKETALLETAALKRKPASIKPSVYTLWNNNCLHFMSRIMDSTGITDWREKVTYFSAPSISDIAFNYAWHYFYAMKAYRNMVEGA
jgi:hypothetical protein